MRLAARSTVVLIALALVCAVPTTAAAGKQDKAGAEAWAAAKKKGKSAARKKWETNKKKQRVLLKGQVFAQPYPWKGKIAVPIVLDKKHWRAAQLRSRIGILMIKADTLKMLPRGTVETRLVRLNDRFNTMARVRPAHRRDTYWRISVKRPLLVARSKTLSPLEMHEAIQKLQAELTSLYGFTARLATYTANGFRGFRADIAALKAELAALTSRIGTLENELAALKAQLAEVKKGLEDRIAEVEGALKAELTALLGRITTLESGLAALTTRVATLETTVAAIEATIATIQTSITNLSTTLSTVDGTVENLTTLIGTLPADTTVAGLINTLQGDLLDVSGGLATLETATNTALGALDGRLDTVEPLVSDLGTNMTNVLGELAGTGGIDGSVIDTLTTDVATALANAQTAQDAADAAAAAATEAQEDVDRLTGDVCGSGGVVETLNALIVLTGDLVDPVSCTAEPA